MAVKLPPNTWKTQVINPGFKGMPSGFVDVVYSKITGEAVGYIQGGKFVQTIDELPQKSTVKKVTKVSSEIISSTTPQAIAPLALDAEYYKGIAENPDLTADERAQARAQYDSINAEIERLQARGAAASGKVKKKTAATEAKNLTKQGDKLKKEYNDLARKKAVLIDPSDDVGKSIENRMNEIENEFKNIQTKVTNKAVTNEEARRALTGQLPPETQRVSAAATERVSITPVQPPAQSPGKPEKTLDKTGIKTSSGSKGGKNEKGADGKIPPATKADISNILNEQEFQIVDAVASMDDEIKKIVTARANGEITDDEMRRRLRSSRFIATNSPIIRQRITEKALYDTLTPEERAKGTNAYAMGVNKAIEDIKSEARSRGAAVNDQTVRMIAEKLYSLGQENEATVITRAVAPYIKVGIGPAGAATIGGAAGGDYQSLLRTAFENGLSAQELPAVLGYNTVDEALQSLATGESINTLQSRIRNYAMTGQSDFVKNQLAQGINLRTIAAPYITAMSTVLELNPQDIKLNDPALTLALKDNGMNIYDYKRALKKDTRWQYTENAAQDVANKTMRILQDFGLEA